MILQERDKEVINFLDKFHAATTGQLATLFFPNKYICQRRLKMLHDAGHIRKYRDNTNAEYIYCIKKETNKTPHYLMLVTFYICLLNIAEAVQSFVIESKVGNVIPDAEFQAKRLGVEKRFFVEIHRSNNPIADVQQKYVDLYRQHIMKDLNYTTFPNIVIVTDKDIKVIENLQAEHGAYLKFHKIKGDSSDIKRIFFH